MNPEENYIAINRESWNRRTEVHLSSEFYDMENFLKGKSSLNDIELKLLGDVSGKKILHLQCHFGQDTISLSRLGAETTGVDLSDKAIESAKNIAQQTQTNANFICCDIYELPQYLDEQFDIVYTSYGVIGWLPDLDKWAEVITQFLKPGGQFVFVEFHPVVWMFDEDFQRIQYPYLKTEAIVETNNGTYADKSASVIVSDVSWNHGLSEVVKSLLRQRLAITSLDEYDYSPYNCFNKAVEFEPNKFRIAHLGNKIPMVYSLTALKKGG